MRKHMRLLAIATVILLTVGIPLNAYVTQKDLRPGIVQLKWASATGITYRIVTTQGTNVTGSRTLTQVFNSSFGAWAALTTASISFTQGADAAAATTYSGTTPDSINIIKTNILQADYQTVGGDALGVTVVASDDNGRIVDADILFNPGVSYSTETTTPSTRIDLESVATHEIGHLLGLDHSSILSATMFPTIGDGLFYARALQTDDIAGVSSIYPAASYLTRGSISGTVRLTSNATVYGALVVAVNSSGQPVASTISDNRGNYVIGGLAAGTYTIYAEPMDQPFSITNVNTLGRIFPSSTVTTSFTTRFR